MPREKSVLGQYLYRLEEIDMTVKLIGRNFLTRTQWCESCQVWLELISFRVFDDKVDSNNL
jgi:hypothetical protein